MASMQPPEKELHDTIERVIVQMQGLGDKVPKPVADQVVNCLRTAQTNNQKVFSQLAALMDYIANARQEIAGIQPDAISGQHIPSATDELDAVVSATEEATNKIMDACDSISNLAGAMPPETGNQVTEQVNRVFEACNFQDITGQRITKVVRTLKHIETQVASLLAALDAAGLRPLEDKDAKFKELNVSKATDTEKHLLNGPQMANEAIKQDDIDKLFG